MIVDDAAFCFVLFCSVPWLLTELESFCITNM